MASVTLQSVTKRYGSVLAVDNVSLEVQDKEFLVLVGPSGCGKSTILRMIAGLESLSGGDIAISGRTVAGLAPKDRDIAMVFQSYALYPHMSVYDNMAFGLRMRHIGRADRERRVTEAAELLQIRPLLKRKPRELSGGERQRVALARAIVREPQVFLMDEPLSNLDAQLRVQTRAELVKLHRRLQTTVIYVTHDQTEAMTMADRIVLLRQGVLQQVDTPEAVYDTPANMFVAGFTGSPGMNFFPGRLVPHERELLVDTGIFQLALPPSLAGCLDSTAPREVVLGVRPEDLAEPDEGMPAGKLGCVPAQVDLVEPLGSEKLLHLLAGEKSFVARVSHRSSARVGDKVSLMVRPERLRLFDPDSGEALC